MVSFSDIETGVAAYLDKELISQYEENDPKRIVAGMVIGIAIKKQEKIFSLLKELPIVKFLDIVDEHDNVDLDTLYEELKNNMTNKGMRFSVPFVGPVTIPKNDIDKIYDLINQSASVNKEV